MAGGGARLIAFEGVDGAGKSTALRFVSERLRAQGVRVYLPREGKEHVSRPTRMIRQLTRDPRNFNLSAQAELLLYCAREAQVMNELVRPALARGETVLVDRSFLTPIVLGMARGLKQSDCESAAALASSGTEPDLTLVFDVHPRTSRLRKRIERIRTHTLGGGGRKGLAGSAFKERVRDSYSRIAEERHYPLFHVERATPDQLAERVVRVVMQGRAAGTDESPLDAEPRWLVPAGTSFQEALESLPLGEALFFAEGLIACRSLRERALKEEPALTAFTLDADDPNREACALLEAEYALQGSVGRPLSGPDDLRVRFLEREPAACLRALRTLSDPESDALRARYAESQADAVLYSLAGRDDAAGWSLRERAWHEGSDEARAISLIGCSAGRSHELRAKLYDKNELLALTSLRSTASATGDAWLEAASRDVPKIVLGALAGRQDDFAYRMRDALFDTGREVIDTIRRLDDERAYELRERALPRWASTVAHSLLGLPDTPRVRSLYQRCRALGERDLHVQRRLLLLDEQPLTAAWARARRGES
ncbi:MAG: dTMP kinase [Polyangiales bacterium]